jgi:hypothetical protein
MAEREVDIAFERDRAEGDGNAPSQLGTHAPSSLARRSVGG